jgi:hypothetical protein
LAVLLASGFFPGAVKEAAFRIQNLRMFISGAASLAFAGWLAAICLGLLRMALGVVMPVLMLATLTRPHVKEAFAEAGAIRRKET